MTSLGPKRTARTPTADSLNRPAKSTFRTSGLPEWALTRLSAFIPDYRQLFTAIRDWWSVASVDSFPLWNAARKGFGED